MDDDYIWKYNSAIVLIFSKRLFRALVPKYTIASAADSGVLNLLGHPSLFRACGRI